MAKHVNSVQHIPQVNPDTDWKWGIVGDLTTIRGMLKYVSLSSVVSAATFTWAHWIFGVSALTVVICGGVIVFVICRQRKERLKTDHRFHQFYHLTRDDFAQILFSQKNGPERAMRLERFHRDTVQRLALFYRDLLNDETVNCAIRLAEMVKDQNAESDQEAYVTKGRSDGMSIERQNGTKPIPGDKYLANALRSQKSLGVYIIHDIQVAADAAMWLKSENDNLQDVKTLMIAPINGWESTTKVMVGILYVTSAKDPFLPHHSSSLKAFADSLGMIYPILLRLIEAKAKKSEK